MDLFRWPLFCLQLRCDQLLELFWDTEIHCKLALRRLLACVFGAHARLETVDRLALNQFSLRLAVSQVHAKFHQFRVIRRKRVQKDTGFREPCSDLLP